MSALCFENTMFLAPTKQLAAGSISNILYEGRLPLWYLRFTASDCHFGILDLRLLIATLVP
jgi:hypothetical protein